MAARDAALNTCEILEHIIAYLPPRRILTAERVCKTWKELINNSTKISHARCLVPFPTDTKLPLASRPAYEIGAGIRYHPTLGHLPTSYFYPGEEGSKETIKMSDRCFRIARCQNLDRFHQAGAEEYLTNPRIEALYVVIVCSDVEDRQKIAIRDLRAVGGLRIRDLWAAEREVLDGLDRGFGTWTIFGVCYEVVEPLP